MFFWVFMLYLRLANRSSALVHHGRHRTVLHGVATSEMRSRHSSIEAGTKDGSLRIVTVAVEEPLRSRLRLTSRQRRVRLFVDSDADEETLRSMIAEHVPQLRSLDYALLTDEQDLETALKTLFKEDRKCKLSIVPLDDKWATPTGVKKEYQVEASAYQMVSWYGFFTRKLDGVEDTCKELEASWARFGVLGRAYVAAEGVNAQLAVPVETMQQYEAAHLKRSEAWIEEGLMTKTPTLNRDRVLDLAEFAAKKPFRALHVRPREQVVSDGNLDLDWEDAGYEATPAEWHTALGGDYSNKEAVKPLILDCRNHYESAVGTFSGSKPLETETFKETYAKVDQLLDGVPKTENVHMFCTGGIRCVKVGAYVKQVLGYENVTRLQGGVVNYTRHLKEDLSNSQFRGVNYVFDERMGERITEDDTARPTTLDPRSAEALAKSAKKQDTVEDVEAYAERLSDGEPEFLRRVRLDAEARWPRAAHMVCGPAQGRLLAMLCSLGSATRVLEVGTFCGYGALWLASSLGAEGTVVTVEKDPTAAAVARAHFERAVTEEPGWGRIELHETDRADFFKTLNDTLPFDLVYVDADKKGYAAVYDALMDRGLVKKGGLIIADNTLWKGRVLGVENAGAQLPAAETAEIEYRAVLLAREEARRGGEDEDEAAKTAKLDAKATKRDRALQQAMHEFNVKLRKDRRVENLVLNIRDGLTIARVL